MNENHLIDNENYGKQTEVWYRAYDISTEKIILFYDFLDSIHTLMDRTYLGVDVMDEEPKRTLYVVLGQNNQQF